MSPLTIGLMTGTSADGVDAALVEFEDHSPRLLDKYFHPYPADLRKRIIALAHSDHVGFDELFLLDAQIAEQLAIAVERLLRQADCTPGRVSAIGSHGQTIRHRPQAGLRYTVQIGNPNILVARTGIDVITDFRRADMAFGGQGAPFASLFHEQVFREAGKHTVVLNLGGIANITVLQDDREVIGFDTGPANALLDDWIKINKGLDHDADGAWAASGTPDPKLLASMLADDYFKQAPPKSTGREYFGGPWLDKHLKNNTSAAVDVQATLCELTARTIADAIERHCPACEQVYTCGGGAKNQELLRRLGQSLPGITLLKPESVGIDGDFLEAMVFAWLAERHLDGLPGNLPSVTGSRRAVICGCHYPATH
ncbi:MAG: anhydro-N-acetylmuramic acid kinase [Gammaproteobacteria bacterium]|nr:anhydro-N-acetylmuramic acid kinase [Gammaproteobacteria bacterium]